MSDEFWNLRVMWWNMEEIASFMLVVGGIFMEAFVGFKFVEMVYMGSLPI